jgi:hypothetical protein
VVAIFKNARVRLKAYDSMTRADAYNAAAGMAYRRLATGKMPRGRHQWESLGNALGKFNMDRQMGSISSPQGRKHLGALRLALTRRSRVLKPLLSKRISVALIQRHSEVLARLFDHLSSSGRVVPGKRFPVGVTKTLHFLNPEVFLVVDRRVAERLRICSKALPKTASRYTGIDYVNALQLVASELRSYGIAGFRRLQPGQPTLRIVDKILFMP